jgi:gliding motility-associated-like protein
MEGFEATPPASAWQGIQESLQQVPASPATDPGNWLAKVSSNISKVSAIGKIVLVVGGLSLISVPVYFLNESNEPKVFEPALELVEKSENTHSEEGNKSSAKDKTAQTETAEESKPTGKQGAKIAGFSKKQPDKQDVTSTPRVEQAPFNREPENPDAEVKTMAIEPVPVAQQKTNGDGQTREETREEEAYKPEPEPKRQSKEMKEHARPFLSEVITPNGDGSNDVWMVQMDEAPVSYYLRIYNSKQELVFETHQYLDHWKGISYKTGEFCPEGRYGFELQYRYPQEAKNRSETGLINLIR